MIDRFCLYDTEDIVTMLYEKYLLSRKIQHWDDKISRLNAICDHYEANQPDSDC